MVLGMSGRSRLRGATAVTEESDKELRGLLRRGEKKMLLALMWTRRWPCYTGCCGMTMSGDRPGEAAGGCTGP